MTKYKGWLTSVPIAHRGLHNSTAPENTLKAFERAIEKDYAIELDLHLTKDGKVIVFHDDNLLRAAGTDMAVADCLYEEIASYRLFGTQERVPLFSDMLKLNSGRVPLLIEIKPHDKIGCLEEAVVRELKEYTGEYAVQSFNPYIVRWFSDNAPHITRGLLAANFRGEKLSLFTKFALKNLFFAKWCGAMFIAYRHTDLNRAVRRLRKKMPVLVYTIQNKSQLDNLKGQYDNIIFEGWEA